MKNMRTLWTAGTLVILALIYYFTQTGTVATKSIDSDQFVIDKDKVKQIEVITPSDSFSFSEQTNIWKLDDYPVDTMRMNRFIDQMTNLSTDRLITSKSDNHSKYELDDEQGTSIVFKSEDGSEILNLIIGKRGANYQETFVREFLSDKVYAVKSSLSQYQNMKAKNFWDRTMTNLSVDQITGVEFVGDLNYSLKRNGPLWTYDNEQVDLDKVTNMLRPLENLKASGFSDDSREEKQLYQSLRIALESGESIDLNFYIKDEKATVLLVKVSDHPKTFEYAKSGLNRFKKSLSDLQPDPVPEG